jgi:hypothetical protein
MATKIKDDISVLEPEERKPPVFSDYLKPSPFERPWMLSYLPKDPRGRDVALVGIGCALSFAAAAFLHELGVNDYVAATVCGVGISVLYGDSLTRNILASINYKRAKKNG